jgi:hypothetical protein
MKLLLTSVLTLIGLTNGFTTGFTAPHTSARTFALHSTVAPLPSYEGQKIDNQDPLLIRAIKGLEVER